MIVLYIDVPESRHESQIEVEDILQPLDSGCRLVCEHLDQVRPSLVSGRLERVLVELLDTILDTEINLSARESSVDSGGGLGRVSTKEVY